MQEAEKKSTSSQVFHFHPQNGNGRGSGNLAAETGVIFALLRGTEQRCLRSLLMYLRSQRMERGKD